MIKFQKLLESSNKDIKTTRAKLISEEAADAMEEILREKRKNVRDLDKRLLSLGDLHRDSELSLRVVKDNFNPKQWLSDLYGTKVQLLEAQIELQVAEELHNDWFGEEEAKKDE